MNPRNTHPFVLKLRGCELRLTEQALRRCTLALRCGVLALIALLSNRLFAP